MTPTIDLARFSFHDSSLVGATHHGSTIVLTVEYFDDDDSEACLLATISGIDLITRNDMAVQEFRMETTDGEIYRLIQDGHEITLVVSWHKYTPHSKTMQHYKMRGSAILLQAVGNSLFNNMTL